MYTNEKTNIIQHMEIHRPGEVARTETKLNPTTYRQKLT